MGSIKTISVRLVVIIGLLYSVNLTAQNIINGPYLANPGEKLMSIRWESQVKANFTVEYGRSESYGKSIEATLIVQRGNSFLYEVVLDNLKSGKRYFYRLMSDNKTISGSSFRMADSKSPLTFTILGDSRSKPKIFSELTKLINETDPAAIIANGDLVAKGGSAENWHSQFFTPSATMINHTPFLSAVGDHESDDVDGDSAKLFSYYLYPHKNNMKLWFSYDIGNAHFIFLDWRYPYSEEMIDWFKSDISSSDKRWKFVVLHRSPYNLGGHHVSWGKNVWPDLFQDNRVDIVFSGHSHLYERYYPIKPKETDSSWAVTYITTGGAGASLAESNSHPSLAYSKSVNHFLNMTLEKNQIKIRAIRADGVMIDSVAWEKDKSVISGKYLTNAFSKEEMDVVNVFNSPLSQRISGLPMVHVPYQPQISLDGTVVKEEVVYVIRLADESKGKYLMEPVKGVLKPGTKQNVALEIFSRTTMTVSKWGTLTPVLRLVAEYRTKSFNGTITGSRLEYIAY